MRTCTSFLQAARQLQVLGPAARRARQAAQPMTQLTNGAASNLVLEVAAASNTSVPDAWPSEGPPSSTKRLEMAVSLLQHHDAITGTAKQLVADDYHLRLSKGEPRQLQTCMNICCPAVLAFWFFYALVNTREMAHAIV